MPAALAITLKNLTDRSWTFVLFQRSVPESDRGTKGWRPYVWDARSLSKKASWGTQVPLDFQLTGVSQVGQSTSTTNIEDARYGDVWVMKQEEGGEFFLERLQEAGQPQQIRIWNTVAFARRVAEIWKNDEPLLRQELNVDEDVTFALQPTVYVGISSTPLKKGTLLDESSLQYIGQIEYAKSPSTYEWSAQLLGSSDALELRVEGEVRTARRPLPNAADN